MGLKGLFLEDLAGLNQVTAKNHIATQYGQSGYDEIDIAVSDELKKYKVMVAYESVGSWGCDSSSYFLLQNRETGIFYEFSGSHCSCYGFEGQFDPQEAPLEYLKSDKFHFYCGGYDGNETSNQSAVKAFISKL